MRFSSEKNKIKSSRLASGSTCVILHVCLKQAFETVHVLSWVKRNSFYFPRHCSTSYFCRWGLTTDSCGCLLKSLTHFNTLSVSEPCCWLCSSWITESRRRHSFLPRCLQETVLRKKRSTHCCITLIYMIIRSKIFPFENVLLCVD